MILAVLKTKIMIKVSPNLSKTLSLTLDILDALEKRDFEMAFKIDQKRRLYCKKDTDFNHYDWIKFNLVKRIQEALIDEIVSIKKATLSKENKVYKNIQSIKKGYFQ